MINETPCRHCTKRKINCHASCEEYLGWRKKADELRDKCGKARLQDAGFVNAKIKNICVKNSRRAGRHKAFSYRLSCFLFARFYTSKKGNVAGRLLNPYGACPPMRRKKG